MKIKKKYIIIIVVLLIFLFLIFIFECSKIKNNKEPVDMDQNINLNMTDNEIEFIQSLVGLKSKDLQVLDNPLRIEGAFYIPEETVKNYIEHYLKKSNNKYVEDIEIIMNEKIITIGGKYKLLDYLKTPIDIDILPTLTKDNDLKLALKDIRLLNISLNDKIVDAIVESWFSDLDNIKVDSGDVIINKKFFGNSEIKSIKVEEDYLVINLSMKFK